MNTINPQREHSREGASQLVAPVTFRLPKPGHRDPYFGLPRTAYYELEKAGTIQLIRLRKRGYQSGTTLIPFDQVTKYLHSRLELGQ